MEWQGDEATLQQLCQLFQLASSPDNAVQQQVLASFNQLSQLPDFCMYLVTVFNMPTQDEIVRQRAGLLLKTNLNRANASLSQPVADYILVRSVGAVRDPSRVIRHTAGAVISTIVQKVGVMSCAGTLDQLAEQLLEQNVDVVEGSLYTLKEICEDGVTTLKQFWDFASEQTEAFVTWCTEKLLPRVFDYASPSVAVFARREALETLNHFALNNMFSDTTYPAFQPFAQKYLDLLGRLAQDNDPGVLRDICKGFVCIIENKWTCLLPQQCELILQFMLKASQHPEYAVRLEALEVWTPCSNSPQVLQMLKPLLPELVPVLLGNMVYSSADYTAMEPSITEDDNAAVPDQQEDIRPRFHKEQGREEPEEEDERQGGAWGAEWTARKAAASALDHLATAFRQEILQVVLPLIQLKLEDTNWEVQESGVLALGAIAYGCMENLVQFLPKVLELLLKLSQAQKPLLRSISCWCAARFSHWICHDQNPNHQRDLAGVVSALLQRILDKNKRVQEAACSAFATLEEEARSQLVPHLDDIVGTLVRAFQYYQAKNLLMLYDVVGTLAESVGSDLTAGYAEALMVPLLQKFEGVADNDRAIIVLFECLSALAQNLGTMFMPMVPQVVQRCVRLAVEGAKAAQMWQQNPNEFEKPDREVMTASIDLLSGITEGLQDKVKVILVQHNFLVVLPECLKDTSLQVKQSAFALMGDAARFAIDFLAPMLPVLLPLCAQNLLSASSSSVCNNASWAVGEVCVKVGPDVMQPYLEELTTSLVALLCRPAHTHPPIHQNVCITLGRLAMVCGHLMGESFGNFARMWCVVMKDARPDHEKVNAFQGLCNLIKANPQAVLSCVPELTAAICSFYPAPSTLEGSFRDILHEYKRQLGDGWPSIHQQFPTEMKVRLQQMYQL